MKNKRKISPIKFVGVVLINLLMAFPYAIYIVAIYGGRGPIESDPKHYGYSSYIKRMNAYPFLRDKIYAGRN